MRVVLGVLGVAALGVTMMSASQAGSGSDEDAVRALVGRYNEARDGLDEGRLHTLFTADADQLVSSGEWRRGRTQLLEGMTRSSRANPGDRTLTVEAVRLVSRDVAIADARYEIAGTGGAATRRMWSTFVAVRTDEGWRLDAIRNMLPAR